MKKLNQKGFSAVEGLLVLVIILLVGFIGYYVWHSQTKSTTNVSSVSSTPVDTYASWNTVKLPTAKVSFRYPVSWKAGKVSTSSDGDTVSLTGTNGYTLQITYGTLGHPSLDYAPTVRYSQAVNLTGQKIHLDYIGGTPSQDSDGLVYAVQLSKSTTDAMDTPSIGTAGMNVDINGAYGADTKGKSLSQAKADVNYRDSALVISSAKNFK